MRRGRRRRDRSRQSHPSLTQSRPSPARRGHWTRSRRAGSSPGWERTAALHEASCPTPSRARRRRWRKLGRPRRRSAPERAGRLRCDCFRTRRWPRVAKPARPIGGRGHMRRRQPGPAGAAVEGGFARREEQSERGDEDESQADTKRNRFRGVGGPSGGQGSQRWRSAYSAIQSNTTGATNAPMQPADGSSRRNPKIELGEAAGGWAATAYRRPWTEQAGGREKNQRQPDARPRC